MKCTLSFSACGIFFLLTSGAWSQSPALSASEQVFAASGYESEMKHINELFWLHYPGSGPKATMWEEWLSMCSLWPATDQLESMRTAWRDALTGRIMEADGYVATHQHGSIAHQTGWPFPFWKQSERTWGWHFQLPPVDRGWHGTEARTEEGWRWEGCDSNGVVDGLWTLAQVGADAVITAPTLEFDAGCSPFLQLRWKARGLGNAEPYVEWIQSPTESYSWQKRFYFSPVESDAVVYTQIPVYRHPAWNGTIRGLRIGFDSRSPEAVVQIDSCFTTFDTRHTINNPSFILGSDNYFRWTRDIKFLRENIARIRTAMRYILREFHLAERHLVLCDWVGHDGRAGYSVNPDGTKEMHWGHGIGSNYWDLLPFGHLDAYATNQSYSALLKLAALEESIANHPEWGVDHGALAFDPEFLRSLAEKVRAEYQKTFWNPDTKRFVSGVDADGNIHDFGLVFLNLETLYYGLASEEQAKAVYAWLDGERVIEGDTSQGEDIYHWRFGPRATTKRNVEWYFWAWTGPETIPWGYQVQDGGAVLGFSYFDVISRLAVLGPDSAWNRLMGIAKWFGEVQAEGGYRAYYGKPDRGSMQGGGTPGGLGLDNEFFESALVPQALLYGFLGFQPEVDGFFLWPNLPSSVPSLSVQGVAWRGLVLDIEASVDSITVAYRGRINEPITIGLPEGGWKAAHKTNEGEVLPGPGPEIKGNLFVLNLLDEGILEFTR